MNMKKLSFVCSFLFILFLLIGCTTEDTGTTAAPSATSTASTTSTTSTTSSSTTASTISSPSNLQYSEGIVEWDAVTNAFGYQIQIDSEVIDVTGTTYTFDSEDYGRFVVSVRTVYGINSDIVSEYSNPLTVTIYKELPVPSNVVQTGSLVTWSVVEDSTGYVVKYDGSEHFTNLTQFDINVVSPTNVQVMAVGSTENYIEDSVYSDPILFSIELDSPTNVHYENGVLYWDAVSLASGYYLTINDGTPITVTGIQYDLDYAYVGSVTVSVIAYSDTTGYLYSETQDVSITCPALNLDTFEHRYNG